MNSEAALTLRVPLDFLGDGRWSLRAFGDTPEWGKYPERISETAVTIAAGAILALKLAPAGGCAAVLSRP